MGTTRSRSLKNERSEKILVIIFLEFLSSAVVHQRADRSAVPSGVGRARLDLLRQKKVVEAVGAKSQKLVIAVVQRIFTRILSVDAVVAVVALSHAGCGVCRSPLEFPLGSG